MSDIIDTAETVVQNFIGRNDPDDQIVASLILGAAIIATSSVGLVGTLLLVPFAVLGLLIGLLRLWEPFDARYPL